MKEREGSLIVLNRSVVIGIIVLVTTISFTFGYFVGRYSAPKTGPSGETGQEISGPQSASQSTVASPAGEERQLANEEKESGKASPYPKRSSDFLVNPPIEEKSPSGPVAEKSAPQPALQQTKKEQPQSTQPSKEGFFKKDAYYLQVGAFREESRAIKLRENLKKETAVNSSPYDVIIKKDGSSVYRVYVGAFKTRKEALLAQTRIKKLYGIDSIIIKK